MTVWGTGTIEVSLIALISPESQLSLILGPGAPGWRHSAVIEAVLQAVTAWGSWLATLRLIHP